MACASPLVLLISFLLLLCCACALRFVRCACRTDSALYSAPEKRNFGNELLIQLCGNNTHWCPRYFSSSAAFADYWAGERPAQLTELVRQVVAAYPVSYPAGRPPEAVLHFRCADVPFKRHVQYPLLPAAYYRWAARELSRIGVRSALLVSCWRWGEVPESMRKCTEWAQKLSEWFGEEGVRVSLDESCRGEEETLRIMLDAGTLVSSGGSFSFVAGVGKGTGFITPSLIGETTPQLCATFRDLHLRVPWRMWPHLDCVAPQEDYADFAYTPAAPLIACASVAPTPRSAEAGEPSSAAE